MNFFKKRIIFSYCLFSTFLINSSETFSLSPLNLTQHFVCISLGVLSILGVVFLIDVPCAKMKETRRPLEYYFPNSLMVP
jgi:hypothetical protein